MKDFILLLALSSFIFFACDKSNADVTPTTDVTLRWDGEYALDGCGFIFVFKDGTERKATNEETIPDNFKSNTATLVEIEFDGLDGSKIRRCFSPVEFETLNLLSVKKK